MKVRKLSLSQKMARCPKCGTDSKRHLTRNRVLHEVGVAQPTVLEVTYSMHYCPTCRKHFALPMGHLARPGYHFTNRVVNAAIDLVRRGLSLEKAATQLQQQYKVRVPTTTLHDWSAKALSL